MNSTNHKTSHTQLGKRVWRDRYLYIMIVPTIVWFLVFCYLPMGGLVIAFQNYRIGMGMFGNGEWVGLTNFKKLFADDYFQRAFFNTLIISFYRIIVCLPGAVILSVMLTEVRHKIYKSVVQTLTYIPYFLSWIIVASFAITLLNPDLGINLLLKNAGMKPIMLTDESMFRGIVVFTDLWKDVGFNSIVFMAVIVQIDQAQYESADIDGASRLQKIWFITLPALKSTILVVMVLWIGSIINVGFDQVFNLYNPVVYSVGDIIDTYIYRISFAGGSNKFSLAAAAGLFKSVICMVLLLGAELIAKSLGESAVFE